MRLSRVALVVGLTGCLAARSAPGLDELQLAISASIGRNLRTDERILYGSLTPVGPLAPRVRAGRVTISHALDDTGAILQQETTNAFHSVSVGRIDDSKDLTSREPTPFVLAGVSKGARALADVSGLLELVIPDLDPGATLVVADLPSRFGVPIRPDASTGTRVVLTVFDRTGASAAAAAKAPGGPQEYDFGPLFGTFMPRPPGFPKIQMDPHDVAVAIEDPEDRIVDLEFQAGDGSPLRYNHGGNYHSNGPPEGGRRFDTYHLEADLPADARLVCWLATPKAVLKAPFHLDRLPLPGADAGNTPLGVMHVRLEQMARHTGEAAAYDQGQRGPLKGEKASAESIDRLVKTWSDVPEYVALYKDTPHYTKLPQLVHSVRPESPPGAAPHPQIRVLVSFAVDDRGNVEAARVVDSDDSRFDIPAVEAVLLWKFKPAELNGSPAVAMITVPIVFRVSEAIPSADPAQAPGSGVGSGASR